MKWDAGVKEKAANRSKEYPHTRHLPSLYVCQLSPAKYHNKMHRVSLEIHVQVASSQPTLFTLDMMAKMAESVMSVVSIPLRPRLRASCWPW